MVSPLYSLVKSNNYACFEREWYIFVWFIAFALSRLIFEVL